MKQIINDNTVKNVRRWAQVVNRLSTSLANLRPTHDAIRTAQKIKGVRWSPGVWSPETVWRNLKKNKDSENLPISWIRDTVRNITNEVDAIPNRISTKITVPSHKYRACLVALVTAAKAKLNQAIQTMDHRLEVTRLDIKATNEHLELIGDVELSVPHVSRILNPDDYNSGNRLDDPVRIPEDSANPEGSEDSSAG